MGIKTAAQPKIEEWEVRSAVETLQRAEEIKNNPTMMRRVKGEVQRQQKALNKVAVNTKVAAPAKKKKTAKGKK